MKIGLIFGLLVGVALLSCAKRGFPPGGPEDTVPPFVVEIEPKSGSTNVPLESAIRIVFSEKMNKRSVETNTVIAPGVNWKTRYWKGQELVMVPEAKLAKDVTYIISVSGKAKDAHGVAMANPFCSGFSTGDSLGAGSISGKVFWKKIAVEGAMVNIVEDQVGLDEAIEGKILGLVTFTGKEGRYKIPFVDVSKSYRLIALIDDNLNHSYDAGEKIGCFPGSVGFGISKAIDDVNITLCETGVSGMVKGNLNQSMVDTISAGVILTSVEESNLVLTADLDASLGFEIQCVKPSRYLLQVFADQNRNHKFDPDEKIIFELADTIEVKPCQVIELSNMGEGR